MSAGAAFYGWGSFASFSCLTALTGNERSVSEGIKQQLQPVSGKDLIYCDILLVALTEVKCGLFLTEQSH